jgi:ADP-ribose pyrophosphatase
MTQPALELLHTDHIYSGKIIKVDVEQVRLPNGRESVREIVRHPGAAVLVVVDDQERLLLVRQYRRAADRALLEMPAGTREPNEAEAVTAARELEEETGFRAATITRLGGFYSAPGFCTEYLHCYLCTDLSESDAKPEDDESFEHERLTVPELQAAIRRGEIEDAKTLGAFTLYLLHRGQEE